MSYDIKGCYNCNAKKMYNSIRAENFRMVDIGINA